MKPKPAPLLLAAVGLALVGGPAAAHPGHEAAGLLAGLAHPLAGLDHLLAVVALGLWAGTRPERAQLVLPAFFLAGMAAGALAGPTLFQAGQVELAVLASVIVLGLLVAGAARAPVAAAALFAGVCGLAHGAAHGIEAPAAGFGAFMAGMLAATALLHGAGYIAARALGRIRQPVALRLVGAATALAGLGVAMAGAVA